MFPFPPLLYTQLPVDGGSRLLDMIYDVLTEIKICFISVCSDISKKNVSNMMSLIGHVEGLILSSCTKNEQSAVLCV